MTIDADIEALTLDEIFDLVRGRVIFERGVQKHKLEVVKRICDSNKQSLISELREAGREARKAKESRGVARKRQREGEHEVEGRQTRARIEEVEIERSKSCFLTLPSDEERKACYRQFYEATSNKALSSYICAVCARRLYEFDVKSHTVLLQDVPDRTMLAPVVRHASQQCVENCLLQREGIIEGEGLQTKYYTCDTCYTHLQSKKSKGPPKYALANGLWVGEVPIVLQELTFSEQQLIAILFPRVHVFKLFPKRRNGRRQAFGSLQTGMRGTVSTYALNNASIVRMIEGELMPRPLDVLARVLSITFVGKNAKPQQYLKDVFRVRRNVVHRALMWLKANNRHYSSINICMTRLEDLPEDDVPDAVRSTVKLSSDTAAVEQEHAGYVPNDDEEAVEEEGEGDGVIDSPDVVPLNVSGSVDVDMNDVSANELMNWALGNLWQDSEDGVYAVRHGVRPVNDFGRPRVGERGDGDGLLSNVFERSYPRLYPYGVGGLESTEAKKLTFLEHIRWSLQYFDRRFRRNFTFAYQGFGMQQRRETLGSAKIMAMGRNSEVAFNTSSMITVDDLKKAASEEKRRVPISNPAVKRLKRQIHGVGGRVVATDQARYRLRSQIWSTSIYLNPPSIWMTVNPCDLHDPVMQVFVGEDIDLDRFCALMGPDKQARAMNVSKDPFAAAQFFQYSIKTMIRTLFQVTHIKNGHQMESGMGIFGRVSAYFGVVEAQSRGTLHLHMLVWLLDAPSYQEMQRMLASEEFRERLINFLDANIHAYLPGFESAESVQDIPNEVEVGFSRPPHPDSVTYDHDIQSYELRVARAKQVHTCEPYRCLVSDKNGRWRCKRRAPFPLALDTFVKTNGEWGIKRLYAFMNGWSPAISINLRCNNDQKFLTNGGDTKNCSFYACGYAAKKQGKDHNYSAIFAKEYAYHLKTVDRALTWRKAQQLLHFRLMNAVNREQIIAGPLLMSYLMGWNDTFKSHSYSNVFWTTFVNALLKAFPTLKSQRRLRNSRNADAAEQVELREERDHIFNANDEESVERSALDVDNHGNLYARSQVNDYALRGEELEDMNVLQFFVDTYEIGMDKKEPSTVGRPRKRRFAYLNSHPRSEKAVRIRRDDGHNNLPNFIGQYFPRQDDPVVREFFCASMLVLLQPWRNFRSLKEQQETWEGAYNAFYEHAPERVRKIITGIQYFHECERAAEQKSNAEEHYNYGNDDDEFHDDGEVGDAMVDPDGRDHRQFDITEVDIQNLLAKQRSYKNEAYAVEALMCLSNASPTAFNGMEDSEGTEWCTERGRQGRVACGDDMHQILKWQALMQEDVHGQNGTETNLEEVTRDDDGDVVMMDPQVVTSSNDNGSVALTRPEVALTAVNLEGLKEDQKRAYEIVMWHLQQTLSKRDVPPLRMLLSGEGGTGKSRVIQTITEGFHRLGCAEMLLKAAFTGVAASLINGKTTHSIGMIPVRGQPSANAKQKLADFWRPFRYLIIDEYSMLSKEFFAKLSKNVSIGKCGETTMDLAFAGLDGVLVSGDGHQFPPVAGGLPAAIFMRMTNDSAEAKVGREYFHQFDTVVILKEQMRVSDPVWLDFLRSLRNGTVDDEHMEMLRSQVLGSDKCPPTNLDEAPWNEASVVTPRHSVRVALNKAAVRRHCRQTGNKLYVCTARDTIKGNELTTAERFALIEHQGNSRRKTIGSDLPEEVELAIGMKVMVTANIETDLDIANGSRGEIVDIILDPEEHNHNSTSIVTLEHMPLCVLVRLPRTRARRLPGLDEGVIPICPRTQKVSIKVKSGDGNVYTRTVLRAQYAMTGAYAFTDYRAQGQSLQHVLVDIASPPTGKPIDLFSLYVALSRSSGRDTIRLIRDFDDSLFTSGHDAQILEEDDRLERLHLRTKSWWKTVKDSTGAARATGD